RSRRGRKFPLTRRVLHHDRKDNGNPWTPDRRRGFMGTPSSGVPAMTRFSLSLAALLGLATAARATDPPIVTVEGQPLAANAERLAKALDFLGAPLPADTAKALTKAIADKDAKAIQEILDKQVLFLVNINPESRVKVARGPADAKLQQAGWTPVLVKVVNESTVKKALKILSPQSGNVYSDPG